MTTLVRYEDRIVATVGASRIYLAPETERLPDGDPVLRFVVLMCAFALDVRHRRGASGYSDDQARRFARSALIDDDEWFRLASLDDDVLARRFGIPVAEIAANRDEFG